MDVDDIKAQLRQLREELHATEEAFRNEWASLTPRLYIPGLTRLTRMRPKATTAFVTYLYFGFSLACFVAGIILAFSSGVAQAAGIALIVGALFSISTLTSVFWGWAWQREMDLWDRVYGDARAAKLKDPADRAEKLEQRIDSLRQSHPEAD